MFRCCQHGKKTLLDQHETLKAEYTALKIQITELVSKSKETSHVDTSSHHDKEATGTATNMTNKESQTATASMSDLPSDSEDGEHDISLVIILIDELPWITVLDID